MAAVRTLGIEEEMQIVDAETGRLASRAPQLLGRLPSEGFAAELQRSTVETNTAVCSSLDDVRQEVLRLRGALIEAGGNLGLEVVAAGTAPIASASDMELTARGRYRRMQEDYRFLVDEHLICGLQVHATVDDDDVAVRIVPRVEHALPTLLALSASSPFWGGADSGYASVRAMVWQRWPTAGRPPQVDTSESYAQLLATLIASGVISDVQMAYFDVRPSPHLPTLELRVCDSCPLVDDVVLIAGLWRAVVEQAEQDELSGRPADRIPGPLYRAAMWRAARSGLSDTLLGEGPTAEALPAAAVVENLVRRLRPQLEEAGDWGTVSGLAAEAVARGTSSERQRASLAERGRLSDVVDLVVGETAGRAVAAAGPTRWSAAYRATSVDEAVHPSGTPVAAYRPVFAALERLTAAEMSARGARARAQTLADDVTFGVRGEARPYPVDLIPRVLPAHEWAVLAAGLTQRARAIEAFLRDAYGPARIVADGVLGDEVVRGGAGWRPEGQRLPEGVVRAPVVGFDLVRDSIGGWRVLEDNVRVPSGVGYAIALRNVVGKVLPELTPVSQRHDPRQALGLIGRTLRAASPVRDAEVALLSEGADNSGWYEHRLIAAEVGLLLAQPSEIDFRPDRVLVGGRRVHVVYLRLACELVDLVDASGRAVGAQLMDLAARGEVVVVNAPGNGVADDKAMYCHIPDLIAYYLQERPLLAPVPTYRCADPAEREPVLDRLEHLVTKPVGGYGGVGVLIGSRASASEIELRRREIVDDPAAWVAQEEVALSTLPTLVDGHLEPRYVDLRAFVYLTGTGAGEAELAPLGLTRVAPPGSMVVNSSQGGGAKDTWILLDTADSTGAATGGTRRIDLDGPIVLDGPRPAAAEGGGRVRGGR